MRTGVVTWIYLCVVCMCVYRTLAEEDLADYEGQEEADDGGIDRKGTRPRGLAAEVLNSTTISLTWKHPKISTEECPVKRYVLRLKQDGARRSRAWKVDGARRSLGLHNLKPDTLYSIRLVAITCAGKGKPSKWIDIMTRKTRRDAKDTDARSPREEPVGIESRPPGRPTNVRTRTYPDSVILTWQSPSDSEVVVRGYMVGYGEGVPDVNWQYVDANQRNVTIKNLKPSTQYIISLRAFNKIGKGPTVYDMIYTRELSAGPALDPDTIQQPENMRAKVLSPTNIWLQWRDPSLGRSQQITDNRYYNVHYQALPDGEKLSVVVKALHVVLYELTPGTEYEFSVRTAKDAYYSKFSDSIRNITYETAPSSAPRTVAVIPTNGTTAVQIEWKSPKQPNGRIKGYLVLHSNDRLKPIAEWNAMATAETSAIVDDLDPGVTYYFKVQARNSVGYGPLSKTSELTVSKDLPKSVSVQKFTINSELGEDIDEEEYEDEEEEEEEKEDQEGNDLPETMALSADNAAQNASDVTETQESAPSKNKRHNAFEDSSANADGKSKSEVQFAAKVLHTINAFITWPAVPPACNCDAHASSIQYVFHLYMRGEEETPQMRHLPSNVIHLEDLDPNEKYRYQIKYIFPNGTETAWSQEQDLDTDCRGSGR